MRRRPVSRVCGEKRRVRGELGVVPGASMSDEKIDRAEVDRVLAAIDEADRKIVAGIDERMRAIGRLVQFKEQEPDEFFRMPRDPDYLSRAVEHSTEAPQAVESIMREVLSYSARRLEPKHVLYVGAPGGFAHLAARQHFGSAAEFQSADTIRSVIEDVGRGRVSAGVVPLETSSDGAMTATLHGLAESEVRVCGEVTVPSSYHLLSMTGNLSDIEKIFGARSALAACERFLATDFGKSAIIDVPSGQDAVDFVREDHGAAVVGTELLSELHGLRTARERIEDFTGVETRFAIIGSGLPSRTGKDRTVLAMAVHDQPGALYKSLQPFADRGINLTRVESRPTTGAAWRYLFFVEMDGHVTDRPVLTAIEELRNISRHVKVLGSYPRP